MRVIEKRTVFVFDDDNVLFDSEENFRDLEFDRLCQRKGLKVLAAKSKVMKMNAKRKEDHS